MDDIRIKSPGHPRANVRGYVKEHLLVAEKALGKPVPKGVIVHHHNMDQKDNRNFNLVICPDQAYHMLIHARMRALDACGNPNYRPCVYCAKYDDPAAMVPRNWKQRPASKYHHAACAAKKQRDYLQAKRSIPIFP